MYITDYIEIWLTTVMLLDWILVHFRFHYIYIYIYICVCVCVYIYDKGNGPFLQTKKSIWCRPSSDLHKCWCMHEMHVSSHFRWKACWFVALDRYAPGSKGDETSFLRLSLNILFDFMRWDLMDSDELFQTLILLRFLNFIKKNSWRHCYKTSSGKVCCCAR